jgi:hypothetical protein
LTRRVGKKGRMFGPSGSLGIASSISTPLIAQNVSSFMTHRTRLNGAPRMWGEWKGINGDSGGQRGGGACGDGDGGREGRKRMCTVCAGRSNAEARNRSLNAGFAAFPLDNGRGR